MIGERADSDRKARRCKPLATLDEGAVIRALSGDIDLAYQIASWISHKSEIQCFPGLGAGRVDCGGAGEFADVETILTGAGSLIGGFTDKDRVGAVFRHDDGGGAVPEEQSGVIT